MADYRTNRVFAVIIVIALAIVIILVSLPFLQGLSGPTQSNPAQLDTSRRALTSTNADRSVKMSVRGNLVADEDFRAYQIRISPNSREITGYKGYERQVVRNETLVNNIPAYEQFVFALNRAGLMDGASLAGDANDTRGICAGGRLYGFEIFQDNKSVKRLWTTNCSGFRGSLSADLDEVVGLFYDQIPQVNSFIDAVWQ